MTGRMQRVDRAVREVLAEAVGRVKDPRVGFVTVTDAETSPDLKFARIYISVLGTESERRRTLDGLRSAHGFLQQQLGRELHFKHTPTLEFIADQTAERAQRIESLLHELEPEEGRAIEDKDFEGGQ